MPEPQQRELLASEWKVQLELSFQKEESRNHLKFLIQNYI